jgi:lipopolysaccharide export system permease protein
LARFDRYLLAQFMILFGFFALVLVAVYWINQAVRLFDRLIGDGQSAKVFAEFTALMLPDVIRLVLPMSAFAAAVYVTNRLSSDSELVVMQSTGFSPWRLARPVLYFGCIIALMMSLLTHILVPASLQQLRLRESEIAQNVTSKLLTEGAFLHPATGITFYVREISLDGNLEDIFLSDRRDPDRATTYSAARAALINVDGSTRLVMFDGMVQVFSAETTLLSVTYFSEFSYDISRLITPPASPGRWRKTIPTLEILRDPDAAATEAGEPPGRLLEEAHMRFSQPLLCIVAALIGFSTLLVGGYSRFGVWRQVVAAFVLLAMLKVIEGIASDPVRSNPELWPLVYSPALFGFVTSGLLLAWAGRTRRPRRYRAETCEAAV